MSHAITLLPSNHSFVLDGSTSILDTALDKGINLDYGCTDGRCGKCKAKLKAGTIESIKHQDFTFTEAQKQQDYFLMCTSTATSDLILEADVAINDIDISFQEISCKLKKKNAITDYTTIINLQTPRTNTLRFLAGQNIKLTINNTYAYYPIASCPCDDRNLEFHINSKNNSDFSNELINNCKTGAVVLLSGPYGKFMLQEQPQAPTVFLAVDNGFAPIKSLIEHAISLEYEKNIILYLFSTHDEKHYYHNLCRSWQDALDNFTYKPIHIKAGLDSNQYYDLNSDNQQLIADSFFKNIKIDLPPELPSLENLYYYLSAGKNTTNKMIKEIGEQCHTNQIQFDYVPL